MMGGTSARIVVANDLPDAALVQPVDQARRDIVTNDDLATDLGSCVKQLSVCAAQVDGVRLWRSEAVSRSDPKGEK